MATKHWHRVKSFFISEREGEIIKLIFYLKIYAATTTATTACQCDDSIHLDTKNNKFFGAEKFIDYSRRQKTVLCGIIQ